MPRLFCLCLLIVCAFPATASAMEFALQDDNVFVDQHGYSRQRALERAVALGATRIRVNVLWSRVLVRGGPRRPVYDFSRIDALQAAAAARGIRLQLTIAGPAPKWATADHRVGNVAPDPGKYAAFVRAVVRHFAGRVDRYSIWNEPNWSTWLSPVPRAASIYRALYRAGYAAVKRVDPTAQVLIGELAPTGEGRAIAPLRFLRQLTPRGAAPLEADGFALHPYQLTSAPTIAAGGPDDASIGTLRRLESALDALARRHALATPSGRPLDLYLTEFGYLTVGHRAQRPAVRAAWLASAIRIARRDRRVRELLQYELIDPPAAARWHSALLDRLGHPLSTYGALARALSG